MPAFAIEPAKVADERDRAAALATSAEIADVLTDFRVGKPLDDIALAALFLSREVASEDLLDIARGRRMSGAPQIETFSPLYISNECDAECAMCGMRRFNAELKRSTAEETLVEQQLDLLHRRGLRGVAILTGEYHHGELRREMLARTASALRAALQRGFLHVLINVGSLNVEEYAALLDGVPRRDDGRLEPQITMCTFQETYDPATYGRFMGTAPENPRSDFSRRLDNFDRAADAGFRFANPGLLLGLNSDLAYELLALLAHVRHLLSRDMGVYISLPRLRKASGAPHHPGVSDDDLTRIVSLLDAGVPEAKVVISTRESPEIQRRLLPVIRVLTAGSPGVAPYTETNAHFDVEASQFEVLDHRPIEAILGECLESGATIGCYEPAVPS